MEKIIYICDYCNCDYFESKEDYNKHIDEYHKNQFVCYKYKCQFLTGIMDFGFILSDSFFANTINDKVCSFSEDYDYRVECDKDELENEIMMIRSSNIIDIKFFSVNKYTDEEVKNIFKRCLCNHFSELINKFSKFISNNE